MLGETTHNQNNHTIGNKWALAGKHIKWEQSSCWPFDSTLLWNYEENKKENCVHLTIIFVYIERSKVDHESMIIVT